MIEHGVYVVEESTNLSVPKVGKSAVQFIVGTAPVNMVDEPPVNVPIYVTGAAEAIQQLGYCPDMRFTLCHSMMAMKDLYEVGPAIFVNVLDPVKHVKDLQKTVVPVASMTARVTQTGVLRQGLVVSTSGDDPQTLTEGTDYTLSFESSGALVISLSATGAGVAATELAVSGKMLDPDAVTPQEIIGGYSPSTGEETGLELIRQVHPKFSVEPNLALAPVYSENPAVGIALAAKMKSINGVYSGAALIDLDTDKCRKYTDVKETKEKSGATTEWSYDLWPYYRVGDETIISPSAVVGAMIADLDASNDNVPYMSPSNHSLAITGTCLKDGTEVVLDQAQANTLNAFGVNTAININGFRLWGNYTGAYPASSDPKDIWFVVRRMFSWQGNNFINTYFSKTDRPNNPRLVENIVNSENIRMSAFVPDKIAACVMEYLAKDNPTTSIIGGFMNVRQRFAPYAPAQVIKDLISYDTAAYAAVMTGGA